jgi:hypothetical protein
LSERISIIPEFDLKAYNGLFEDDPIGMNNKLGFHCAMLKSVILESQDLQTFLLNIHNLLEDEYLNYK